MTEQDRDNLLDHIIEIVADSDNDIGEISVKIEQHNDNKFKLYIKHNKDNIMTFLCEPKTKNWSFVQSDTEFPIEKLPNYLIKIYEDYKIFVIKRKLS